MQDITWECLNAYYADEELTVYVRDNLGDELEYSIDVEISHMDSQRYMQETYEELANDIYEEYNWNDIWLVRWVERCTIFGGSFNTANETSELSKWN